MPETSSRHKHDDPEQTARQVLELVSELYAELNQQHKAGRSVEPDSDFDHDLGFDSLARAELVMRSEKAFEVSLPEQTLALIATPRDLIREILEAEHAVSRDEFAQFAADIKLDKAQSAPDKVKTLQQLLDWHAEMHPDRPSLYVYQNAETIIPVTFRALQQKARQIASALQARDIAPGDCVAIMLPTCEDYFYSFFGILYARAVPVPIYPPARASQIEDHLKRHANILNNADARLLITVEQAKSLSQLLRMQVPGIRAVVTADDLNSGGSGENVGAAHPSDIAFIQYTSGSTGQPKGVALTHHNLLSNVRAMGEVVKACPEDVSVSWLPVYHDMGLIGAWFGSLYHAIPLAIMSPLLFLSKPSRWLWAVHHHRATLSPAPNFAYELCINKIDDSELEGLDLSSWRLCWNGAEPVSPSTIRRFTERFEKYGFRPETMSPVFGLAECSVGLTFPAEVRVPRIERIQREPMMLYGRAVEAAPDDNDAIEIAGLGQPLPGHQIRIVDELGRELPEREEGGLEFKGPSATLGYYRDPDKTAELYHGDWLDTGDRGFTIDGELFITGRRKDIIIRAGRNIYPHELEEAVCNVEGIRKGCVAVFASKDEHSGTERLVVLAETRVTDKEKRKQLRVKINRLAVDLLASPADDVVLGPPHIIPKTSSGKIRRAACRELYETDSLSVRERAVWWQTVRLMGAGLMPQLRRLWRTGLDLGYAAYMWLVMGVLASLVWCSVAAVPNKNWCWAVTRIGARSLIWLTGTRLTVTGKENLPVEEAPCVLVGNHASYLDGIALVASVPLKCHFVAKAELLKNPFARVFLTRLDTEFVERFDVQQGLVDAKRLAGTAKSTQPLFLFPEGTLHRMAGIHEFHMGAFLAAAEAGIPVIPVTLLGTRSKLRGSSLFPRRGDISVMISAPLEPEGSDWNAALKLRDEARAEILRISGEPDLGHHHAEQ